MINVFRRTTFAPVLLGLASLAVSPSLFAQDAKPVTNLGRQLERIDLAVSGVGIFSGNTSGTNYLSQSVALQPSNTLGAVVSLRYIHSPYLGFEGNYGYARYSQNFTLGKSTTTSNPAAYYGVQSNARETTGGYVIHTRGQHFGVTPFAAIGVGSIAFKPTTYGGEGLIQQYRAAYYYGIGADASISPHIGVRAQFRQLFYKAPDFLTNYLTDNQRTTTSEPSIGVYLRF